MKAKVILKDLDVIAKILQLRVNTWAVLGSGCCLQYHASAGEFSLSHLVQASEDLVSKNAWVQSFQCREIERMVSGRKQEQWSVRTRAQVQEFLQGFVVDPRTASAMHQQLLMFHFRLAELLEELSEEALCALQDAPSMRDVVATWQQALVHRSKALALASSTCENSNEEQKV
jgi:hypothetical protein